LHVHVRDRAEADVEGSRPEVVHQVGADQGPGRRAEALVLASTAARLEGVAQDDRRRPLLTERGRGGERAPDAQTPPPPPPRRALPPRRDDHMLHDRETETRAARSPCAVAAIEPLEEAGNLLLLETAPVVHRFEETVRGAECERRTRAR